ncbi:hypothetical protein EV426DRAFT_641929 [Tirmania nivea]|nr:hypothetical protein EV426DRAFT_641929 [Tirmania nivea]
MIIFYGALISCPIYRILTMGPFADGPRWTRSQSAPPCPGAWSYRILGRFPLPAASVERQQQQQEQEVAVPQAGWPRANGGLVQLHPPGCCVHPPYGHLNAPPAIPSVPAVLAHNSPIRPGHHIPGDINYAAHAQYHQPGYPPQHPIRDHAHLHPTPHDTHHQPPPPHPQVHSHCVYPPPPPSGQQFPTPQTNPVGQTQAVHSHSYSGCQHSHPPNEGQYHNLHDARPQQQHHHHSQGAPSTCLPQGPTWNAVNSKQTGSGSRAVSHAQPTENVPLGGQRTFERPFVVHSPAEGPSLIRTSPGRPHSHSTIGVVTAGTGSISLQKQQTGDSQILPSSSSNPVPHLKAGTSAVSPTRSPSSAPKRTRKSYTREYKLKALNLLNSERPDGKGGMVPASDTWVSRQVGVTRKVLRGWKAQEERLRASRKGSRRVRVGRNRERRPVGGGRERSDKGKGKEIVAHEALPVTFVEDDIRRGTPKSPQDTETSGEDGGMYYSIKHVKMGIERGRRNRILTCIDYGIADAEIGTPGERHSTEDEDEGENDDLHQHRTIGAEGQVSAS